MTGTYEAFLQRRAQLDVDAGFEPVWLPDFLFPFQRSLVEWSLRKGRAEIMADCGMGKGPMGLVHAENVVRKTNGRALILTPLPVVGQMVSEGEKFGIECHRTHDGKIYHGINVTNYERLHYYNPDDFEVVIGDEAGILKNFDGRTKAAVVEFMRTRRYRLLATATAAPNDYTELGNASEALGHLGHIEMLNRFFVNQNNTSDTKGHWKGFGSPRVHEQKRWRFKGHAEQPFWRWVCSWARALRKPSDLGFDNDGYALPPLIEQEHVVKVAGAQVSQLFSTKSGLAAMREERRRSLKARCERAAALVADTGLPAVCWCSLNDEGDLLERLIPGSVQVSGADKDEAKEEKFLAFQSGQARVMVIKQSIGAWGLNWQHCAHMTMFADYSFEQAYQGIRRCWRYGQEHPVTVDHVVSDGEGEVLANRKRKAAQADRMFEELTRYMREGMQLSRGAYGDRLEVLPPWLSSNS